MNRKLKINPIKSSPSHSVRSRFLGLLLATVSPIMAIMAANSAMALPTGGSVVRGAVTIDNGILVPNTVTITQTDDRAVIEWSSFNLESSETAQFVVPSATSATLNRINDSSASNIKGTVNSNGAVYFVNPNGIVFDAGSAVNANGVFVSTAAFDTVDFINKQSASSSLGSGSVSLNGTITASILTVAADTVTINGTIATTNGTVLIRSKTSTTLGPSAVIRADGLSGSVTLNSDFLTRLNGDATSAANIAAGGAINIKSQSIISNFYAVLYGSTIRIEGTNPIVPSNPNPHPDSYPNPNPNPLPTNLGLLGRINLSSNFNNITPGGTLTLTGVANTGNQAPDPSSSPEPTNDQPAVSTNDSEPSGNQAPVPTVENPVTSVEPVTLNSDQALGNTAQETAPADSNPINLVQLPQPIVTIEPSQSANPLSLVSTPFVGVDVGSNQLGLSSSHLEMTQTNGLAPQASHDFAQPQINLNIGSSAGTFELKASPSILDDTKPDTVNHLDLSDNDKGNLGIVYGLAAQ